MKKIAFFVTLGTCVGLPVAAQPRPRVGMPLPKPGDSRIIIGPSHNFPVLPLLTPDGALMSATTVDEWIAALRDWNTANKRKPDHTSTSDAGGGTEAEGGRNYTVTRTKYSITETPEEIVTFQPVNGFWLGGLVQEKNLQLGLGSMQEVPVPSNKRAPFRIATDLPMASNFQLINDPSSSASGSAIGSLMQKGNGLNWGGARTLSIVENYNEDQAAHDLGIGGSYMGAKVKAALKTSSSHASHTVTAAFIERAFTAQADFQGRSRRAAFFRDSFSVDDAKQLTTDKKVTMTNLPAYIKSITYGRVMLFNLSSSLSESEMKTALSASYTGVGWSVNGNYSGDEKSKNTQFELRVTGFGGPQGGFEKLVPATGIGNVLGVMNSFLSQRAPLTSMVPISYSANTLRDDQLAALSRTTSYTVTKSVPNPIGERFRVKMWIDVTGADDGVADNTMECYGSLRINGDQWWGVSRDEADGHKREKGGQLLVSEDTGHIGNRKFEFEAFYDDHKPLGVLMTLFDKDGGSKDDKFGDYNLTLDLLQMGPGDYHWTWKSGGGESSRLNVRVERMEYL